MHHYAIKGSEQQSGVGLASVELFRDHELFRCILSTEWERGDAAGRLPLCKAAAKIGFNAGCGLIALLGGLGEQLHHNRRQLSRDLRCPFNGWHRLARDVTVDPLNWICRREWQCPGEQLVECYTESVEIAARIHRAVHSPSLLGCHVSERADNDFGRSKYLMFAR